MRRIFMASKEQRIFAKIVLHNKLLDQAELDQLIAQMPDPEVITKYMVKSGKLPEKKGVQLVALYRKQIEKLAPEDHPESRSESPTPEDDEATAGADRGAAPDQETRSEPSSGSAADSGAGPEPTASKDASAEDQSDYGGLPPIKIDLGFAEEEDEEELPLLERDTDGGGKPVASSATTATAGGALPGDPQAKEVIHEILLEARKMHASDVHITAGVVPMVRQSSKLKQLDRPALSPAETEGGLLAMLDEQRRERFVAEWDLDFCYDGGEQLGRFRANFLREQAGMDAVFRLVDAEVPSFEKLGLPEQIQRFTEYSQGMILITGPKGSGKTTTLAAMVDLLNRTRNEHIVVIEDPIEYVHVNKAAHVNQREVGTHTKSFGNAMRAALREAPDIIVVGEMRDLETTSLAISAAETGHLVLATLHTPDAIRTIGRVLDVFPPKEQGQIRAMLSESLRGIVSQQLVPNVEGDSLELVVEILTNTPAIGNMIREDRTFQLRGMMQTGRKLGMVLLDDSLIKLVRGGQIAKEEAIMRATEGEYVRKELG
jgi:twitching motility protein PilT